MSILKDKIELRIEEAELETQKTLSALPRALRVFLIGGVIAIIPFYFIAKAVATKVFFNRYQKTALLAKPSFQNPKSLKTSDVSVTTLGPGVYAAAVQIANQNLDLSLDNVPYTVNFYNSQKQQVYSFSDKFFLLPDQTKYLTVPKFNSSEQVAFTNLVLPENLPWQKRINIPTVKLTVSQPNSYQQFSPLAFVVEGDYVNNSPYSIKQVRLTFLLIDQSGKITGVSQRDDFTLAPFERRSYKQLWPNISAGNQIEVKVFADTDTLDPNNLSQPEAPFGKASDLSRPATNGR